MRNLPESDWQTFKDIRDDMFETLCARINGKALKIIHAKGKSQHEKYFKLNKHIRKSDKIVTELFGDFKRLTFSVTLIQLRKEKLLSDSYLEKFSEETQHFIKECAESL